MKIKKTYILLFLIVIISYQTKAQVVFGAKNLTGTSAALEIVGNDSTGLHLPNLTTAQRDTLMNSGKTAPDQTAADGLIIFNITVDSLQVWNAPQALWKNVIKPPIATTISSTDFTFAGSNSTLKNLTMDVADSSIQLSHLKTDASNKNTFFTTSSNIVGGNVVGTSAPDSLYFKNVSTNKNLAVAGTAIGNANIASIHLDTMLTLSSKIDLNSDTFNLVNGNFGLGTNDGILTKAIYVNNNKVGIRSSDTASTVTTLDINGSIAFTEEKITATANTTISAVELGGQLSLEDPSNLLTSPFQVTINNGVVGQKIVFANNTKVRAFVGVNSYVINTGDSREFIYSGGTWAPTTTSSSIGSIYLGQIAIPQFYAGAPDTLTYNTSDWICKSQTTTYGANNSDRLPSLLATYEYQGSHQFTANPSVTFTVYNPYNDGLPITAIWPEFTINITRASTGAPYFTKNAFGKYQIVVKIVRVDCFINNTQNSIPNYPAKIVKANMMVVEQ